MVTLPPNASRFWTLPQAVAWVLYRRDDIVDYIGSTDEGRLGLVAMYPAHFQPVPEVHGEPEELRRALAEGKLKATGIPNDGVAVRTTIPPQDWLRVQIYGGKAYRASEDRHEVVYPWRDIALESAAMKKLWRSEHETAGRSKYDWVIVQAMFNEVKTQNLEMTQNELITEVQGAFEDRFNKKAPSRTTIQRKIKTWT
jgi:hypothetical protein